MAEGNGFLDDTSLSKTPKSPLKTSTVLRPTSNRSESIFAKRLAACGMDASFNPRDEASFRALAEVTNIPRISVSEMSLADDGNSSLGILHIENFSDITDLSLPASSFMKDEHLKNVDESKLCENSSESLMVQETPSANDHDAEESDRNSSPDIEYDGTNIPELNLDYDALSAFQGPTTLAFKNSCPVLKTRDEDESFFKNFEAIKNDSSCNSTGKFLQSNSTVEASNEESRMTRDSLFETFNPAYDSIFKNRMPNQSVSDDDKVSKLSQVISACSFVDGNSSELQAILQNQSQAEQIFLKNLQSLNEISSLKFSPDEMSARSTSFGSSAPPTLENCPESNRSSNNENNRLNPILSDEGLKEVVLRGSVFVNNAPKKSTTGMEPISENQSFEPDSLEISRKANTFSMPEKDSSFQNITCDQSFSCDLNYKDTSRFIASGETEENNFEVSDFMTKDEALEIFKKDEEKLIEEHRFETVDNSKESATSVFSLPTENTVNAPSWFLELYGDQLKNSGHVSIGTLINARTENLGRLSEDSNRERPFFGTYVSTPVRGNAEDSSDFSESVEPALQSLPNASFDSSKDNSADLTNKTLGNEQSTLKSVLDCESEILRRSILSQLLSDASSLQPQDIANRIFSAAEAKFANMDGNKECLEQNETNFCDESSSSESGDADKTLRGLSNELQESTIPTSKDQNVFSTNLSSISGADSASSTKGEEKDSKACECFHCQQKLNPTSVQPFSSCSNSCKNAMPCHNALASSYGCMANSHQNDHCHQNLYSSYGSMQHLGNCLVGNQLHNPCAPNSLPTQMLSIAIPQSVGQGPMSGFSSAAFSMQGAMPYSYPAVHGPNELFVPQKICVDDSENITLTVQNMHTMQYFYHISYVSASINEKSVSIEMAGIHFPFMFPRSMSSTTDIQITLIPKYEGKIVVVLQIVGCLNPSEMTMSAIGNSSLKTKIQYEAVKPSILISSRGNDDLKLGSVIAGSKVHEQILITNKCDAVVPICLSLSNDFKDNHISFRINEMKLQNLSTAVQWKVLSPKTIQFRLPNSNNEGAVPSLEIPIIFEAGNDNCDLNFTLIATLQTATFSEPLGLLRISATVGRAELVLTDATQNRLLLCSETGSISKQTVTVKNQCSFPVVYDLMVIGDGNSSFSVSPSTLNLQPLQSFTLTISFSPTSTLVVKSNLQAAAQPHGKIFDVMELIGTCKSTGSVPGASRSVPPNIVSKLSSRDTKWTSCNSSNIIECNKKYLSWGGVDIGNTVIKTFSIRNCTNKSLQARLSIKEKSQSPFKIKNDDNEHVTNFILGFLPKEQKSISVSFAPNRIAPFSGFLAIKPIVENDQKIFSLPLNGYGGTGKLSVAEVYEKEGIGHCLDIVVSREHRTFFCNLSVCNFGLRPVFVKVVSSGNSLREQIVINPSEFILLENSTKTLIASCSIEDSMINKGDYGFITLLYGDEIIRQQLRRFVSENTTYQSTSYHGVNFDVPFVGEERVPYDSTYVSKINIASLFSSSIKKIMIHLNLVEQDASNTQMSFGALSVMDNTYSSTMANSTMFRQLTAAPGCVYSPPVKDFTVDILNSLSMPNSPIHCMKPSSLFSLKADENVAKKEDSSGCWTVKPETLTINSASKENRILLINLSKQDLKFKIECAIDVISVSPVSGVVCAKGQIGLRICIIPYSYNKLCKDYKGYIKVICDSTEKSVLIKILKDQKKIKDTLNSSESNTNPEQLQDMPLEMSATDQTIISSASIFIKNISEFPKEIVLNATAPGKASETILAVQNPEKSLVEWSIHAFSILFTESLEDSLNASNVLQILPSSGVLNAKEKTSIVVKFMPSNPDCFYRFFELSLSFSNGTKQKANFKISGFSVLAENSELNKSSAVARFSKKKSKDIYIENETCEFPNTPLGGNSTAFVIVKNPSLQDFKLNVTKPRPPFSVLNSNSQSVLVRSKKFLKIPVTFKPTKSNVSDYEDILILQSEKGHEFMIKLKGVCN